MHTADTGYGFPLYICTLHTAECRQMASYEAIISDRNGKGDFYVANRDSAATWRFYSLFSLILTSSILIQSVVTQLSYLNRPEQARTSLAHGASRATYKRRVSSLDNERTMGKHELSFNSGVIGSDVISGAHSFKLRAENLRDRSLPDPDAPKHRHKSYCFH